MLVRFKQDFQLNPYRSFLAGDRADIDSNLAARLAADGVVTLNAATAPTVLTSGVSHGGASTYTISSGAFKSNTNWISVEEIPTGVDAVQIAVLSDVTDVSTYTNVRVYAQTTDLSGGRTDAQIQNPYLNGVLQAMVPVTYGGANSPTFVAATSAALPVPTWSDWIPLNNTGSNAPTYLITKTYYPSGVASGGGWYVVNNSGGRSAQKAASGSASFYGQNGGAGNMASSNATAIAASFAALPLRYRFAARKAVPSLWYIGDSTRQGYAGQGYVPVCERYATASNLRNRPVAVVPLGWQGQKSTQYLARLAQMVALGERCDHLFYQVLSPNNGIVDGWTASTLATVLNDAHAAIRLAAQMGASITLESSYPVTNTTPTAGMTLVLNGVRDFIRAMDGSRAGVYGLLHEGLHDPSLYGKWIPAYNDANDGLHQSEAGTTAVIYPNFAAAADRVLGYPA